jgi:DNA end-binding protein Ku
MAAQRPIWRGQLRLALVSCPVALYSANHDRGSLHFNRINPKTGHRIRMITQDAETGEELARRDLVKGYEFKKDTYLIVDDADFESARIESSSAIKIDKFVDAGAIDPIYFDASYYVGPDGDAGLDVFVVLRDAIAATGKMALSRVVIARRERPIAIMPMGKGLVVHTLHDERDLNDHESLFEALPGGTPDPDMVELATQLIKRQGGRYDPADVEDRYEARLRAVIDAKLQGEGIAPDAEDEPGRGNVIDLMAALKKSLGQGAAAKPKIIPAAKTRAPSKAKPPAKKPAPKKARAEKPTPPPRAPARKRV